MKRESVGGGGTKAHDRVGNTNSRFLVLQAGALKRAFSSAFSTEGSWQRGPGLVLLLCIAVLGVLQSRPGLADESGDTQAFWRALAIGGVAGLEAGGWADAALDEFHPDTVIYAITWSVVRDVPALLRGLINQGADVNGENRAGGTALHAAAFLGQKSMVRTLLDADADALAVNANGQMPIGVAGTDWETTRKTAESFGVQLDRQALESGRRVVIRVLYRALKKSARTNLFLAAALGDARLVRKNLNNGADPDVAQGAARITALTLASALGHTRVVKLLVEHGADIHDGGQSGTTPLHLAALFGHESVVRMLLDNGADRERINNRGLTPGDAALLDTSTTVMLARLLRLPVSVDESALHANKQVVAGLLRAKGNE